MTIVVRHLAWQPAGRPCAAGLPRRPSSGGRDGRARLARARRRLRRRRLLRLLEARGVDGRGIELSREGVNRCVAKGLAGDSGRRRHRLGDYPDDALRLRDPVADAAGDAAAARRARAHAAHRPARHRLVPEFRPLAMRLQLLLRGQMPRTDNLPASLVRYAEHSLLHHQGFRSALRRDRREDGRPSRSTAGARRCGFNAPWWFWNLFGEQGVFLLSRQGRELQLIEARRRRSHGDGKTNAASERRKTMSFLARALFSDQRRLAIAISPVAHRRPPRHKCRSRHGRGSHHRAAEIVRSRPVSRIDVDRRAAHDPLDDLQPRASPTASVLPTSSNSLPRRPAGDVEIAAKAQRIDRLADDVSRARRRWPG